MSCLHEDVQDKVEIDGSTTVRFANEVEGILDLEAEEKVDTNSSSPIDADTSWETKSSCSRYENDDILHADRNMKEDVLEEQGKLQEDVLDANLMKEPMPTNRGLQIKVICGSILMAMLVRNSMQPTVVMLLKQGFSKKGESTSMENEGNLGHVQVKKGEMQSKGVGKPSLMLADTCMQQVEDVWCDFLQGKNRMDENPILNKFCYTVDTVEELHEEHGLSLEVKVAKDLSSYDWPDDQWRTVFQHRYQKNAKVYLHHLQPSFIDDCRLLFHKVYQGPPSCGKITAKFSRCYAFEKCHAAKKDPARHKIAWARFGESALSMCNNKPGGLDKKVENWKRANGAFRGGLLGFNKKRHYTQGAKNMCNIEEKKVLQFETVAVDYIFDLDAIVHGVLTSSTQKLNRLFELRASLQQKKESLLRLEDSNVVTKKIKENECVVLESECAEAQIQSEFVRMRIAKINEGRRFTLFPRPHIKDEENTIYALGYCVACGECLGSAHVVEYEVKEEYTDNHAANKHSKTGHMFDEEMEDGGKFCDVGMHEAATRSFQGMSNIVQSDKLDEDKDTTTGAHEGVSDCREEPNHEVLPDQQDVDKEHLDKDQQEIDKNQKVEVDDEN
ncbi:hypothetical protein L7F22_042857 [Adiantum nelumboides]|nr:hypothetical protein [Adiantum nelumboides]